MTTRREALVMIGAAPLVGIAVSASPALGEEHVGGNVGFTPDRELLLNISDNFQRQHWSYAGQRYTEDDKPIIVEENECIRLILINDTDRPHSLLLDGLQFDIAARKSCKHDLVVAHLQPSVISNPAAGVARAINVRPTYQKHAAFLA